MCSSFFQPLLYGPFLMGKYLRSVGAAVGFDNAGETELEPLRAAGTLEGSDVLVGVAPSAVGPGPFFGDEAS